MHTSSERRKAPACLSPAARDGIIISAQNIFAAPERGSAAGIWYLQLMLCRKNARIAEDEVDASDIAAIRWGVCHLILWPVRVVYILWHQQVGELFAGTTSSLERLISSRTWTLSKAKQSSKALHSRTCEMLQKTSRRSGRPYEHPAPLCWQLIPLSMLHSLRALCPTHI